ncbi:MAG: L-asparaginase II [Planctomycetota bacterium]
MQATPSYPDQPVLVRAHRGAHVESVHRGSWVLVDGAGAVVAGAGDYQAPIFTRSAIKCLQALPLIESGAAERFGVDAEGLALAISSHNGEGVHVRVAGSMLAAAGYSEANLLCGPQLPGDPRARTEWLETGAKASPMHNNCSGKHAGFLTLSRHLGVAPERYLDPESETQRAVRAAVSSTTGLAEAELEFAIDGCSAPTWRLPLQAMATAFARVSTAGRLGAGRDAACAAMTAAAAEYPGHVAGEHRRLCTALLRASQGRLFPKIGAEGVYAVGLRGSDRAIACKIDDGGNRALHALVIHLCAQFGFLEESELAALAAFRGDPLRNRAGLEVGRLEVLTP